MAQSWYNAIQAGAANLLQRVKEEMKSMQPGMEVKHLGWIAEQVCEHILQSADIHVHHLAVIHTVRANESI